MEKVDISMETEKNLKKSSDSTTKGYDQQKWEI